MQSCTCRGGNDFTFESMFDLRTIDDFYFEGHHFNGTQYVHSQDSFTSPETLARPVDNLISSNREGKDYPELFKIENGALVDETVANQIAQDALKFVKKQQDKIK